VQLGFELAQCHCQGNGVVQGGVLAVLLDFAIAFAVMTRLPLGAGAGTVTLTTQMLRAAGPGPGTVGGRIERLGRTLAFGAADCAPRTAGVIATATAVIAMQLPR
jgi:acyl-coenzyme A thioesterase PaaI-like protein